MAVSPKGSEGSAKNTTKAIREWAIGEGLDVSSRGRIPAEIEQAFHNARAKKARAKPAKNTATKKKIAETPAANKRPVKKVLGEKAPVKRAAPSNAPAKKTTKAIRAWAIGKGLEVSSHGRIPAEIERAFDDAQSKKAQDKPASVKKTAAAAPVKRAAATKAPAEKAIVKKPVAATKPVKENVASETPMKKTTKEIRAWAIGAGHEVSSRGRIPAEIEHAFHDAHTKKAQVKPAPVKKTAAKTTAATKTAAAAAPVKRAAASKAPGKTAEKKAATKKAGKKTVATKETSEKTAVQKTVTAKAPAKREVASTAPAKNPSREIRAWAIEAGHEVSPRGRIPVEIERAFHDAQAAMPVV